MVRILVVVNAVTESTLQTLGVPEAVMVTLPSTAFRATGAMEPETSGALDVIAALEDGGAAAAEEGAATDAGADEPAAATEAASTTGTADETAAEDATGAADEGGAPEATADCTTGTD